MEGFVHDYIKGRQNFNITLISERTNILIIAHQTHLGQQMMVKQLRGRMFWNKMNLDIDTMVKDCDPCQRYPQSHLQEKLEMSHTSMFDIWPGRSIHMDLCSFKNVDYCFIVDRLTGYIQVEKTPNQCTESAILAVKHWAKKFGYP